MFEIGAVARSNEKQTGLKYMLVAGPIVLMEAWRQSIKQEVGIKNDSSILVHVTY